MIKVALFVRLIAKPGKEQELAGLLEAGRAIVAEEQGTPLWFAVKFDESTYAIFDAFEDESGREQHLGGKLASILMSKAPDLLAATPVIERAEVIAAKV